MYFEQLYFFFSNLFGHNLEYCYMLTFTIITPKYNCLVQIPHSHGHITRGQHKCITMLESILLQYINQFILYTEIISIKTGGY